MRRVPEVKRRGGGSQGKLYEQDRRTVPLSGSALLGILAAGLFGAPLPALRGADWERIFAEAHQQAVFPIVFAAAEGEAEKEMAPEAFQRAREQFFRYGADAARNDYAHGEVHRLMSRAGIPYVILKGQASAAYYPEPSLRTAGDVDFLVDAEDLDRAGQALEEAGFRRQPDAGHECHRAFYRDGGTVEMHWQPTGIPDGEKGELIRAYLADCIPAARISGREEAYRVPDDFHHGLILLLHMANHLVHSGIGLRHLCDWAVFVHRLGEDAFPALFREKLARAGLWRFARLAAALAARYLGMPEQEWAKGAADPDFLEAMMGDLMAGGNFGRKDPERINEAKLYITNGRMKGNMAAQLAASMTRKARAEMPACRRVPALTPVGWAVAGLRHLARVRRGERPRIRMRKMVRGAAARRAIYREFRLFE